jgi:acyl transferase domain-containing protein
VDQFEPQSFGLSPREAAAMDPQQRLLLEVAWEALEDAALPVDRLSGSRTGVFVGLYNNDYAQLQLAGSHADAHEALGSALGIAPGRLSYILDFQGPSLLVDTLCSSSAVAVHLACQSLRTEDCDLALAGGVNLTLSPHGTVTSSRLLALSPDGRCKTFDARANGYVRGEGCGLVVLKRLSNALKDRDPIWAVIRGSAVNQDGRSTGLTTPNVLSQQAVIRQALANAGVSPEQVEYIEAHGTGTPLGDPIEVDALRAVYGKTRESGRECTLGSVKTNLGHLESAAGIAGLLKAALAVRFGVIPGHLHFKQLNPRISLAGTPFVISTSLKEWPAGARHRIAGVSSFGLSGTNAHLIVEQPPAGADGHVQQRPALQEVENSQLLTLSARTEEALRETATRYGAYLDAHGDANLADVCFTTQTGRSHFERRLAVVARNPGEAAGLLREVPPIGRIRANPSKLAFLFSGQGGQYPGMGRGLYDAEPLFRASMDRCAEIARPLLDVPLLSLVFETSVDHHQIDRTSYTQVALFAIEWSLAQLWIAWGIKPDYVLGHSFGEYVAASVAGAFSVEEGLKLVAIRGQLMQSVSQAGSMATIYTGKNEVEAALAKSGGAPLSVAAINAPKRIVISGPRAAVEAVCADFNSRMVETRLLAISQASHSALMDSILDEFERVADQISAQPLVLPLASNLTGDILPPGTKLDGRYWRKHLRQTVQLTRGIETLAARGCETFLEMGPHPTLTSLGPHILPESAAAWLPSLRQGADDRKTILESLGQLYISGVHPDWPKLYSDGQRRLGSLPTYSFQRQRYWANTSGRAALQATTGTPTGDPLLGVRLRSALPQIVFESQLSMDALPFLGDHRVQGAAVLPAAAMATMAKSALEHLSVASAATAAKMANDYTVTDLVIREPLFVPDHGSLPTQFVLTAPDNNTSAFQLFSFDSQRWRLHAEGVVRSHEGNSESRSLDEVRRRCLEVVSPTEFYDQLREYGLDYGPLFRGLAQIARTSSEAIARVESPEFEAPLLDSCFQLLGVLLSNETDLYLPLSIERLAWHGAAPQSGWIHAKLRESKVGSSVRAGDIGMYDAQGRLALHVEGLALGRLERRLTAAAPAVEDWLQVIEWRAEELPALREVLTHLDRWLVVSE